MSKYILVLPLISLLIAACSNSKQAAPDPIPTHASFTLHSTHLGEERKINVWTPPQYRADNTPLPVLYMLDGGIKEDFPHIANTLAELVQSGKIRPVVLVGIENTQRRRDLTGPTEVEEDKKIAPVVGGSAAFRAFLSEELFADVARRYKITAEKGIIGESLAGLFVAETFFLQPQLFDFYIAFDPSLWWNNQTLLKAAPQHLATPLTSKKRFWFAASGAEDILTHTNTLADALKAAQLTHLSWQYEPRPKEQHQTIFRATKVQAITWALGK